MFFLNTQLQTEAFLFSFCCKTMIPQILLSINIPTNAAVRPDQQAYRTRVIEFLASELDHHEIVATWLIHDPGLNDVLEIHNHCSLPQEFSVVVTGEQGVAQRQNLSQTLSDRLTKGRNLGVRITTLSLPESVQEQNLNLLVKHRISMVNHHCGQGTAGTLKKTIEPRSLRFGIWEVPAPLHWVRQLTHPVRELVLRSAMHFKSPRAFQHIQIDVQALLQQKVALEKIAGLLRSLVRMKTRGKIDITPIRSAATLLRHQQTKQRFQIPAA